MIKSDGRRHVTDGKITIPSWIMAIMRPVVPGGRR
jgi:hypothetical protein